MYAHNDNRVLNALHFKYIICKTHTDSLEMNYYPRLNRL